MALIDEATLIPGAGNYFTADVDTPIPVDLSAPGVEWESIGHTSLTDIFGVSSEGGDATIIGTLQNSALRTKYSKRQETFNFTIEQWDTASLKLYYGSNATVGTSGELQVPDDPQPTVKAFLVVFTDGTKLFAFHAPKAEILRADDVSFADTENLVGLPLGVKPLISGSNNFAYAVTPIGDVTP